MLLSRHDAFLELEKIQQQLLESCPAWLDKDTLAAFCEQKMRYYLGLKLAITTCYAV
jgi:hypothetical protein